MSPTSPALTDAFALLRLDLYTYLDEVEFLSEKVDDELARKLIPDLVTVIRGILVAHKNNNSGHCKRCGTRVLGLLIRREPWPCDVVNTVHSLLKDPDKIFRQLQI
jgi:hypothetical protein